MWQEKNNQLYKEFVFENFKDAFAFMTNVATIAEKMNHHPRWENEWNKVRIWLSSHEAGNTVTEKDTQLAAAIDALMESEDMKVSAQHAPMVTEVKLFGDGGSRGNPGPSAGGFALLDMHDNILLTSGKYLGITTNNQAEYHSLKGGLEAALEQHVRIVHVFMDSLLVINQMKGLYKVKNRDLWPIHEAIKQLVTQFKHVDFTHVPREFNKLADGIVNKTLDENAKHDPDAMI
jgi:pterin-4a-carbinolamine dehydratase/ribonuclease HI